MRKVPCIELLERRALLSATFSAHISFQPAGLPLVSGYDADTGAVFGPRSDGLNYGWEIDNSKNVHLHKTKLAPDLRYNTDALLQSKGKKVAHSWSIQVPDGDYSVRLVVGDGTAGWKSEVMADGVAIVNGKATAKQRWLDNTATITVNNGLITLTNGSKINSSKLAFIDIESLDNNVGGGSPTGGGAPPVGGTPPPTGGTPPPGGTTSTLPTLVWNSAANAPIALAEAQSVVVGGKMYVMGGYNITQPDYQPTAAAEVFDPATNTWSTIASMPAAETHMGVTTDGQNIYVAGGYTFDPKTTYQTFATTNVFKYNVQTNTWSTFVSLPAARGAGALVYLDGQLHFMDGVSTSRAGQTDHWALDLSAASPQWTTSTALPESANHTSAVVLDGKIYVVGGQSTSDDSTTINSVLMWDPANPSSWTAEASMPVRRSHAIVVVADDEIVVIGGTTGSDIPLASVLVYDPKTNEWSADTNLPSARLAAGGGVIGNEIIVATGFGNGALQAQTWEASTV